MFPQPVSMMGGLGCCCNLFNLAAFVCLIVALWQALSGQTVQKSATEEPV